MVLHFTTIDAVDALSDDKKKKLIYHFDDVIYLSSTLVASKKPGSDGLSTMYVAGI